MFSETVPSAQVPEETVLGCSELTEVGVHVLYSCTSPPLAWSPVTGPRQLTDQHLLIGDGDSRLQRCHVLKRADSQAGQPAWSSRVRPPRPASRVQANH